MPSDEHLDAFRLALDQAPPLWRSVDIRTMAVDIGGTWYNVLTRCRLRTDVPSEVPPVRYLPRTKRVVSLQQVITIEGLPGLLDDVLEGTLEVEGFPIRFMDPGHQTEDARPYRFFSFFDELATSVAWAGTRWLNTPREEWPTLLLTGAGPSLDALRSMLPRNARDWDAEIHTSSTPMDGILGMAEHVIGLKPDQDQPVPSTFRVEAPFEGRFDTARCRLYDGELDITLYAGSDAAIEHLSVGCIAMKTDTLVLSETLSLPRDAWSWHASRWVGRYQRDMGEATAVTLLLRVGDRRLEKLRLTDFSRSGGNPRLKAYADADHELSHLRANLSGIRSAKADSEALENGTARLLALLGFQSIRVGPGGEVSNAADVIAFDPYNNGVLIVECTTGALDSGGKLGKLHLRANQLRSVLPHHTVRAVLVTSLPHAGLEPSEMQKAARSRTSVWSQEVLKSLVDMAEQGVETRAVLRTVAQHIPSLSEGLPIIRRGW